MKLLIESLGTAFETSEKILPGNLAYLLIIIYLPDIQI